MWVSAATSAAAAQAASGEPNASECRLRVRDCVTAEKQCRSPGTSEAASFISARTGVIPRVPIICALVMSAPSQCERSISSRPETPGKRYLLPPEKPTTSCGKTGPTISVTSCSTTLRLMRTCAVCSSIPSESSAIRSALIVPTSANVDGSHQAWLSTVTPGYGAPRCAASASSLIAPCVPSATSTVTFVTRPCSAAWISLSSSGSGMLRVPSGTSTHTLRPSRSTVASWSRTNARTSSSVRTPCDAPIRAAARGSTVWLIWCNYTGVPVTDSVLALHPDRLLPVDPETRAIARRLYDAVRDLPIVSPHGHVDPRLLLDDERFPDPATLFVTPDHYVTRLLHASGVPLEALGVGQGPLSEDGSRSVWRRLCEHWSVFRGTPMRLWLEAALAEIFDVTRRPSAETADALYDHLAERLAQDAYRPRAMFERFGIEVLATTDDPCDDLSAHQALAADDTWTGRVIPTFRPDRYLEPAQPGWAEAVAALGAAADVDTGAYEGYVRALEARW